MQNVIVHCNFYLNTWSMYSKFLPDVPKVQTYVTIRAAQYYDVYRYCDVFA